MFDSGTEPISLKFRIQNETDDEEGFIWVVGSKVSIKWVEDENLVGQIHITIKND